MMRPHRRRRVGSSGGPFMDADTQVVAFRQSDEFSKA